MNYSFYLALPSFLQNVALTAYGFQLSLERYSGRLPASYRDIDVTSEKPLDIQLQQQESILTDHLRYAGKFVPFYVEHLESVGLTCEDVNARNFKEIFPILTKQQVLGNITAFVTTDKAALRKSVRLNTSGSSGSPMQVISSKMARRLNYLFYESELAKYQIDHRTRSTTFAGRILFKRYGHPIARFDRYNQTQYLSSYDISPTTVGDYISALEDWRPEFIDSYPSALTSLITLARREGLRISFQPKLVLTSSETITSQAREQIGSFFSCDVLDHYGNTEMAVSAFGSNSGYRAHPLYAHLELAPIQKDMYSIIATGLLNRAMPLIRYDVGDVVYSASPSNAYEFDRVEGRKDDLIVTPEGNQIGRIDPAFKGINGIREAQVVQHSLRYLEVKVVLNESDSHRFNKEELISNLRMRTSDSMEIEVVFLDEIPKSANGKFRSVVSHMRDTNK